MARPASTAQLAAGHFLSPATVSYHLGVLHQAGLVARARSAVHRAPCGAVRASVVSRVDR
ncbi:MarR family transcriptional regulator [Streptomyces sp. NPDC059970]|uniref:MarR family transcriptional regulator n=1 Tax=Streptomyces sp. NPDC059970 TaxID=3347019 RepID=UPI00369EA7A9